MCGRFSLTLDILELQEAFPWVDFGFDFKSRYNIAPSQYSPVVPNNTEKKAQLFRWGLIPPWAKDPKISYKMINARAETLAEKPSYRKAYQQQRCLVLADGFYEWKKEGKSKAPFFIRMKSGLPFAFAGIWEKWQAPNQEIVFSFSVITTKPNSMLASIHQRMPVILPSSAYDLWLDSKIQSSDSLNKVLQPYPSNDMEIIQVSRIVNSPSNDSSECIKPIVLQ